jgi:hypothetical protein
MIEEGADDRRGDRLQKRRQMIEEETDGNRENS